MKTLLRTSLLLFLLFLVTPTVQAEVIRDFAVNYQINSDGTVLVEETILYDFEAEERRGIFRTIEKDHPQPATAWYKYRRVGIELISVTRNGQEEPLAVTESKQQVEYKIGNPYVTISGPQTYQIQYLLSGALSYGSDGAEFYWNVTGNEWPVLIESVSAVVSGPLLENFTCYRGYFGESNSCEAEMLNAGVLFSTESLDSGEGLTLAVEVNEGGVATLIYEKISYLPFGFGVAILWLLYFARSVYRLRSKDRSNRPVIAQYEPLKGYLPMYTGVLFDGQLDPRDITAGIVYLAEQGFIKIKRTGKKVLVIFEVTDYEITLLRPLAELPNKFLREVSGLLFSENTAVPATVMLSSLSQNRVANSKLILSLRAAIREDLKASGLITTNLPPWTTSKTVLLILLVLFFGPLLFIENGFGLVIFVFITSVFIGVMALVDRFTARGHELKNHLEGFKLFLSVTDKERFAFHNAPEKSPELFMEYLPYAIALGVEDKWAKVFADITIPEPDWYEGGSISTFSATALASDIGAFSSSFSASSGTSGSSGGGSSGGGGGGGGGGSW
ncbi:MAG TPA: DUF2207 domain-containing protein [Candidatus Paceibacterota bacterium]|nr:DUF2207 domain-containing protein [Candidatus Paceibacterota bacterium]